MTPAARIAAAIELLAAIETTAAHPADAVANDYFRARRFIGGGDRRAVSDRVWQVLRTRRRLGWWLRGHTPGVTTASPRLLVAASLLLEGGALGGIASAFSGGRFAPAPLDQAELATLRRLEGHTLEHRGMPGAVRLELPDWLLPRLAERFGAKLEAEMHALLQPAPLDLRVNLLKATRKAAQAALAAEGLDALPTPISPWGLRVASRRPVTSGKAFQSGLVEIQDEGSQLVAALLDAGPGQRVCDFCAGAGGKTLALAMVMANRGQIAACDTSSARLDNAVRRLRRAGVSNVERHLLAPGDKWAKRRAGSFDRVLVDAPCSGTGTWRRNPDARHRLTEADLAALTVRQASILDAAAPLVRKHGRMVYATCAMLFEENEAQVMQFLDRHPGFSLVPLARAWPFEPAALDLLRFGPAASHTGRRPGRRGHAEISLEQRPAQPAWEPLPVDREPASADAEQDAFGAASASGLAQPGPVSGARHSVDPREFLTLTPARHGTDGFFAAVLERVA